MRRNRGGRIMNKELMVLLFSFASSIAGEWNLTIDEKKTLKKAYDLAPPEVKKELDTHYTWYDEDIK